MKGVNIYFGNLTFHTRNCQVGIFHLPHSFTSTQFPSHEISFENGMWNNRDAVRPKKRKDVCLPFSDRLKISENKGQLFFSFSF